MIKWDSIDKRAPSLYSFSASRNSQEVFHYLGNSECETGAILLRSWRWVPTVRDLSLGIWGLMG